jgi:hypothetical protein
MKDAKEPRILKQGSAPVALLMPMESVTQQHRTIKAFDFKSLTEVKAAFVDAGYSEAEVTDMIEAMSELPHYADRGIKKSQ